MGLWLSRFLHEVIRPGSAIYDCSPGALVVGQDQGLPDKWIWPGGKTGFGPGRVRIPSFSFPEEKWEQLAGELLEKGAEDSGPVYNDITWWAVQGPRRTLLVGDPEFVGVYCDFGAGLRGLALLHPAAVTIPKSKSRYDWILEVS